MMAAGRGRGDTQHDVTRMDSVIDRISAGRETRADRDLLASMLLQAVHDSLYLDASGHPMRPEAVTIAARREAVAARTWLAGPIAALYLLHLCCLLLSYVFVAHKKTAMCSCSHT